MRSGLRLRLFGELTAAVDGAPLPPLRSRKVGWLLAFLVLHHGRELDRTALAGVLWPDSNQEQALANLRQSLGSLRAALGPEAKRLESPGARTLRLNLCGAEVDLLEFDAAAAATDAPNLERAVELYTAPLLAGCMEDWLPQEREARSRRCGAALERLAALRRKAGAPGEAAAYLRRAIALDPTSERLHRSLLQALAAAGDYAEAVRTYHQLRRDLGTPPEPETLTVLRQIREAARARSAADTSQLPAGVRRLPRPLTELVGRQLEAQEAAALLHRSRLVTLIGPGGIGKTRLAIHVADAAAERFPQGAWFIDLSAIQRSELVPEAVVAALELKESGALSARQLLLQHLRSGEALLVLDNCEQVLDGCARLAEDLLNQCGGLRILATSRQRFDLAGELVLAVPPLRVPPAAPPVPDRPPADRPPADGCLDDWLSYDAVKLFVERASATSPSFRLTTANAPAVAEICRRLDGIALAIELAASRVRVLSAPQIAQRLDERFRILVGGDRMAAPRQQTLEAAIGWSFDLLSETERRALRRLSVFVGGCSLEAARHVLSEPLSGEKAEAPLDEYQALDLLTRLVDRSLLQVEEDEVGGEIRYRILESIREFALARLRASGEEDAARLEEVKWLVQFAEEAHQQFQGKEQFRTLGRMSREVENLRAAMDVPPQNPAHAELLLRLVLGFAQYWNIRSAAREARRWIEEAVARCQEAPSVLRGRAMNVLGAFAWHVADYPAARQAFSRSLEINQAAGDPLGIANAFHNLGLTAVRQGDLESASRFYEQSLEVFRSLNHLHGTANALNNLGTIARLHDDLPLARRLHEESLVLIEQLDDQIQLGVVRTNLGFVARREGHLEEARRLFEQGLEWDRKTNSRRGIGTGLHNLSLVLRDQGKWDAAQTACEEALELAVEIEDRVMEAAVLHSLCHLALLRGDPGTARELSGESLTLSMEVEDRIGVAGSLESLAEISVAEQEWQQAARLFGASEVLREAAGAPIPTPDRPTYNRAVAAAETALGPEAFAAIRAEGGQMSLAEVVRFVRRD